MAKDSISFKGYDPTTMFSKPSEMTGVYGEGIPLARGFVNARYDVKQHNLPYNDNKGAKSFKTNAGAVQLFNRLGQPIGRAYPSMSESNWVGSQGQTYAHSERTGMRDLLNGMIPDRNGEIERPDYYVQSRNPNDHRLEVLQNIEANAPLYQRVLEGSKTTGRMWSDRNACADGGKSGGACGNFVNSILPTSSKYGYIAENEATVKPSSLAMRDAFQKWAYPPQQAGLPSVVNEWSPQQQWAGIPPAWETPAINQDWQFSLKPGGRPWDQSYLGGYTRTLTGMPMPPRGLDKELVPLPPKSWKVASLWGASPSAFSLGNYQSGQANDAPTVGNWDPSGFSSSSSSPSPFSRS